MKYIKMKQRHEELFNSFPMMFAFSDKQFEEGMEKLGLTKNDTDKIVSIGGGGYIRKADVDNFNTLVDTLNHEQEQLIKTDDEFVYEMFRYELANHEYCITYDYEDTLRACGLTYDEVANDKRLKKILYAAREDYLKHIDCY